MEGHSHETFRPCSPADRGGDTGRVDRMAAVAGVLHACAGRRLGNHLGEGAPHRSGLLVVGDSPQHRPVELPDHGGRPRLPRQNILPGGRERRDPLPRGKMPDPGRIVATAPRDGPRRSPRLRRFRETTRRDLGAVQAVHQHGCPGARRFLHRLSAPHAEQESRGDSGHLPEGPRVVREVRVSDDARRDLRLLQLPHLPSARSQPVSRSPARQARGDDARHGRPNAEDRHAPGSHVPPHRLRLVASRRSSHRGHVQPVHRPLPRQQQAVLFRGVGEARRSGGVRRREEHAEHERSRFRPRAHRDASLLVARRQAHLLCARPGSTDHRREGLGEEPVRHDAGILRRRDRHVGGARNRQGLLGGSGRQDDVSDPPGELRPLSAGPRHEGAPEARRRVQRSGGELPALVLQRALVHLPEQPARRDERDPRTRRFTTRSSTRTTWSSW